MIQADIKRFGAERVSLKEGRTALVRPLLQEDGEALAAFYAAVPRSDYRFYSPHPLNREQALKNADAALDPCQIVLVLDDGTGGIGGYAWVRWKPGAPSGVFGICVRPDYQGAGAGRALIRRLLAVAREIGPDTIRLTVQTANDRACRLYRDMGFTVVREQMRAGRDGFLPEPEYLMERSSRKD